MNKEQASLDERSLPGLHEYLVNEVFSSISTSAESIIYDLGAGTGAFLKRLQKEGLRNVSGFDNDLLQSENSPIISYIDLNVDMDSSSPFFETGDIITSIEVIEHLYLPGNLFRTANSLLKEGGLFVLTTPNIESLNARVRFALTGYIPFFDLQNDPTHLMPYSNLAISRFSDMYGFKVLDRFAFPSGSQWNSKAFSKVTRILSLISSPFLPDKFPGDLSVYLLKKEGSF